MWSFLEELAMLLRLSASVVMICFLGVGAARADEGAGKKTKKAHAVHGVVVAVEKDKDKDSGTIVIKVHSKKGQAPAADRKFTVTSTTKFERVIHISKGNTEQKAAAFQDVAKGEH